MNSTNQMTRRRGSPLALIVWGYIIWSLVPVLIAVIFSFNDGRSRTVWQGFSLRWWWQDPNNSVFHNPEMRNAIVNSLMLAVSTLVVVTRRLCDHKFSLGWRQFRDCASADLFVSKRWCDACAQRVSNTSRADIFHGADYRIIWFVDLAQAAWRTRRTKSGARRCYAVRQLVNYLFASGKTRTASGKTSIVVS